jgi:hypothetical protein
MEVVNTVMKVQVAENHEISLPAQQVSIFLESFFTLNLVIEADFLFGVLSRLV